MPHKFSRTELLIGPEALETLRNATVAVFGVGGVGSYTVEALARSGVGNFVLVDNDTVCESNINRQLVATTSTIGRLKVDVAKEHILDVNPDAKVTVYAAFFTEETADSFDFSQYSYVVDAIDTISGKLALVEKAKAVNVPIISSMGAGNKLDPTRFEVSDIFKTSVCPLAKVIRYELKRRGIKKLKVVYSKEQPIVPIFQDSEELAALQASGSKRRQVPGSIAFVPSVAGLIIAGEVIKDMIKK